MKDKYKGDSMKEIVTTNQDDLYMIDEDKKRRLSAWMALTEEDEVKSFSSAFPEDSVVKEWREGGDLEKLQNHIAIVKSHLPVNAYFEKYGITSDKIVGRLGMLLDSADPNVLLRTITMCIKLKWPEEKVARINPTQINIVGSDEERTALLDEVMKKVRMIDND